MQVFFYKRHQPSGMHVHYYFSGTCVYIPKLKCVVGEESSGSFQHPQPFINNTPEMVAEGESIAAGKPEPMKGTGCPLATISEIKEMDLNGADLFELVDNMAKRAKLDEKIKTAMELLLKLYTT